ncbi:hypothetical protein FS837_002397 [Tulasnella sp. UAMH 9824]|nr:hypothetical protein FS837_002397 [Tulasnella sp. UAMH 9824]
MHVPSATDAQTFLLQLLVLFFGLSLFGLFSIALGMLCLSLHGTQDPPHLRTSPLTEASPTAEPVEDAIDHVAEARTEAEEDNRQIIQELQAKIQNLEAQITAKATEIQSQESHHESQVTSLWSYFERQRSQSAAAQTALEVQGQNTAADLRAKITRLDEEADIHNATVEQITARHQRELEAVRSNHHSALQTLTVDHEAKTTSLANELAETRALATRLEADLNRALKENQLLESSNARLGELESTQSTIISEIKAQLEGQVTVKAAEIKSLELHHEFQLASIWSNFESQKSHWAAAQMALKVQGQNTVADLHAKIARLEEQVDSHNATVEQVTADLVAHHQSKLEAAHSNHHSNLQTLNAIHEKKTTSLAKDLVEARARANRLEADLDQALNENQLLESSKTRLSELESSQSITIVELKAQLEATSNQLKDAIQEKASAQDRLAAAEAEVESIRTRFRDTAKEHAAVVRQKDDRIAENAKTMDTLRSKLAQQRSEWPQFALHMQRLNAEIATKDAEIFKLKASLSSATSRIVDLEAQNGSNIAASADVVTQSDHLDNEDARTEPDAEGTTSASSDSTAGSLTRSQSMTWLSPTPSPSSLRRRHSVNVIIESAKQVLEEVATATTENLGVVAVEEAAVEQVVVQSAGPESPEPSRNRPNESEAVEPPYPEQGLSASMWAASQPSVKDEPPARPDWAAEAAARRGNNKGKSRQNAAQRPRGEQRRPGPQTFVPFNTSERLNSGKAGRVKTTRNSNKDVRQISSEGDYKYHDYRS